MDGLSKRFVAGYSLPDAIKAAKALARDGILVTFDHLGEVVYSRKDVQAAVKEYIKIIISIRKHDLNAHIAIKLSQIGLAIDKSYCERNILRILKEAKRKQVFIEFDAEQSYYISDTQDIVLKMHNRFNIGVAVQANLRRTAHDVKRLVHHKVFIRLVKGAYLEKKKIAYTKKEEVDANYVKLMKQACGNTVLAIGTHDESIIKVAKKFLAVKKIKNIEFQMLYGIARSLQKELATTHTMRVYLPYGKAWCPYFMRRLAERPANLWFLLKKLI